MKETGSGQQRELEELMVDGCGKNILLNDEIFNG